MVRLRQAIPARRELGSLCRKIPIGIFRPYGEFCKQVDISPGCGKAAPPPGDNRGKVLYFREFPGGWPVDKAVEAGDNSQLSTGLAPVICKIMSTIAEKPGQSNQIPPQLKMAPSAVSHLPSLGPAAILNNP